MNSPSFSITLGTRNSPLARAQTEIIRTQLQAHYPKLSIDVLPIETEGDQRLTQALTHIGGKGLFIKELEEALLAGRIDLAVHSMKDMLPVLDDAFSIGAILPREDPRDVFVSAIAPSILELPNAARVGTASPRRAAQILALRPDLSITLLRGNVGTRLRKLSEGAADATLLAYAGLKRLGLTAHVTAILPPEQFVPAVAQGALGVECRAGDTRILELLSVLHDADTAACVNAERAFLAAFEGNCHTPIAALATLAGDQLAFRYFVGREDGTHCVQDSVSFPRSEAERLAYALGAHHKRSALTPSL